MGALYIRETTWPLWKVDGVRGQIEYMHGLYSLIEKHSAHNILTELWV